MALLLVRVWSEEELASLGPNASLWKNWHALKSFCPSVKKVLRGAKKHLEGCPWGFNTIRRRDLQTAQDLAKIFQEVQSQGALPSGNWGRCSGNRQAKVHLEEFSCPRVARNHQQLEAVSEAVVASRARPLKLPGGAKCSGAGFWGSQGSKETLATQSEDFLQKKGNWKRGKRLLSCPESCLRAGENQTVEC